jgi:hypothetical protein
MGRSVNGGWFPGRSGPGRVRSTVLRGAVMAAALSSTFCNPADESEPPAKARGELTTAPLPQNLAPFNIIGFIESFTLDAPADPLSAGKMVVNGMTVIIPRNTIITMPAAFLTPQQLFAAAPAPWGPTQSGLALSDTPKPFTTYEATLDGNRVGDQFIAGLVSISQQSLNAATGVINFVDYEHGELRVGGPLGQPEGARVQINDPDGEYGRVMTPDGRFTVDPENPTIHAATGYPMCVPRVDPATGDPLCPETNRPRDPMTGAFLSNFVMEHAGPTDPTQQAPFEVGDYITYSGGVYHDDRGDFVSAFNIDANLGIFTEPGTTPSYLATEGVLIGTGGVPLPGVPQEATIRVNIVGFTTDPTTVVDIFGIDVAPCSGEEHERFFATANPLAQGLPGRFRFIVDALNTAPITREIILRNRSGIVEGVANKLTAGQYRTPVGEFIFAENFILGSPTIPLNLQDFPYLAQGSGPLNGTGPVVGQLSPWPGVPTPPAAVCDGPNNTNSAPVANAGPDLTVAAGSTVRLDGRKSFDPDFTPLTFTWTQESGPPVDLNASGAAATFTAPALPMGGAPVTLTFRLTVSDGITTPDPSDTVTVTVRAPLDTVTITAATFRARRQILTVTATSTDPNAILILSGFDVMTNNGDGTYTFTAIGQVNPETVTVNSNLGGSASSPVAFRL